VTTPILEDARLAPTNAYGESKLMVSRCWVVQPQSRAEVREPEVLNVAGASNFFLNGKNEGYGEAQ